MLVWKRERERDSAHLLGKIEIEILQFIMIIRALTFKNLNGHCLTLLLINHNMLIIEIAKIELTGGHYGIMLVIEITQVELNGGHIGIMLIIEIPKIELNGGHIEITLIIEITKRELNGDLIEIMLIMKLC